MSINQTTKQQPIKQALISVSDKTGLIDLARHLISFNIAILATGGTYKQLVAAGISVQEVSDYTGFPEMMDGRVKTLHPKIHAGILARKNQDETLLSVQQIEQIDLVVVNLYPFTETLASLSQKNEIKNHTQQEINQLVEKIDIGGPTLIRAAAKNHARVSIVVNPQDYDLLIDQLKNHHGHTEENFRLRMAAKAFRHTAAYEQAIAGYFSEITEAVKDSSESSHITKSALPDVFKPAFIKKADLRYGENPHQQAAFYQETSDNPASGIAAAKQIQGKPLSFNNIADADSALGCVSLFTQPACVIVKHANPCGIAQAETILLAYRLAYQADPISAYGGIVAFNRELTFDAAALMLNQQFVEVIIAPGITPEAEALVKQKSNVRLLIVDCLKQDNDARYGIAQPDYDIKKISGGLLVQQQDYSSLDDQNAWQLVTTRKPSSQEFEDLVFAWKAVQTVKSNAIVYAKHGQTLGIGAGQTSRVMSAKIAALQAEQQQFSLQNAVMASDAFLPFRDGVDVAAATGISAIIQPGGSKRDPEVIEAANQANIAMIFTGKRHFKH